MLWKASFLEIVPQQRAMLYVTNYNIYLSHMSSYNICEVIKMDKKLIINKKNLKGEDGFKTFSIRIKEETVIKLNVLAEKTGRSRNELINILLDFAIDNSKVK